MKKLLVPLLVALALGGLSGCDNDRYYKPDDSVIPVTLKGIETVNVDNSGELPFVSTSAIDRDAYMLGVKWIADDLPTDDDKFITGPGGYAYEYIAYGYSKAIKCLTAFDERIPADTYVSKYFKEINSRYLPDGVDEGFVLLVAPAPGVHYFRVEYYNGTELMFSHDTQPVEFR